MFKTLETSLSDKIRTMGLFQMGTIEVKRDVRTISEKRPIRNSSAVINGEVKQLRSEAKISFRKNATQARKLKCEGLRLQTR
jgi:hypothetical protein